MVGPTASLTPGSPHAISPPPVGTLVLSLSVSTGWCSTGERRTKKKERERDTEGKRRNERREGRGRRGRAEVPEVSAPPHRQCLTSVAVARPPRDESITLNNVNVSPSQHKTNNHCSLPRPMREARPAAAVRRLLIHLSAFACFRQPVYPAFHATFRPSPSPLLPITLVLSSGAPPSSCFFLSVRFSAYLRLRWPH